MEEFSALNDVVIVKRAVGRMLELAVVANHIPFCTYRADGLIIATPTGSTAYALSAGGPIVYPSLRVIVLAPICPHTLSNRPVLLPDSFELEIRVKADDQGAMLTCDGQESAPLGPTDTIVITRGKFTRATDSLNSSILRNLARQTALGLTSDAGCSPNCASVTSP